MRLETWEWGKGKKFWATRMTLIHRRQGKEMHPSILPNSKAVDGSLLGGDDGHDAVVLTAFLTTGKLGSHPFLGRTIVHRALVHADVVFHLHELALNIVLYLVLTIAPLALHVPRDDSDALRMERRQAVNRRAPISSSIEGRRHLLVLAAAGGLGGVAPIAAVAVGGEWVNGSGTSC
ncbi:hypothetical protein ACLOJK_040819 [Asimina triloba]